MIYNLQSQEKSELEKKKEDLEKAKSVEMVETSAGDSKKIELKIQLEELEKLVMEKSEKDIKKFELEKELKDLERAESERVRKELRKSKERNEKVIFVYYQQCVIFLTNFLSYQLKAQIKEISTQLKAKEDEYKKKAKSNFSRFFCSKFSGILINRFLISDTSHL